MIDYLRATALNWPPAASSLVLALVAGAILWLVHNKLTPFDDREVLFRQSNVGYLVQRSSLALAFAIATYPTLTRTDEDHPWYGLIGQAMELVWVVLALLAVRYIVDFVVLSKADNTGEMLKGNVALGIVEAGFYVGFGFVLNGSLTGGASSLGQGIASTVVFGLLGLAVVVAVFWLHEAVTPWHIRNKVAEGGLTAAFEAAGVLAAMGIVVREGVAGDFTSWAGDLVAFTATVLVSVGTLYLFRWLTNRVILRGWTIGQVQEHNMVGAAAFGAVLQVVVAVSVAAVVRTQL